MFQTSNQVYTVYMYIYILHSSGYNYSITWYNYDYNFHKLGDVGYNGV